MKGVSIIICCYNSAERLPKTLAYIAQQQLSVNVPWELIIVNNNSTDNTQMVAEAFIKAHSQLKVRLIEEKNPGLSHARHKGFLASTYEYMLLCDDDNWLESNYVQNAFTILEQKSEIGVLGGVGEAVAEVTLPEWFSQNENSYAVGLLFKKGGYVKYVYGAGMLLRRSIYMEAIKKGFKSLLSDRKGKELSSGGDLELCYMFQLMGYRIFQSDKLTFKHYVDETKLTDNYRERINRGFAKTLLALRPYDLVVNKRMESPSLLWFKEYGYIAKQAIFNLIKQKDDWTYLKSSLSIMLTHQKEFRKNVMHIRAFAASI